MSKTDNVDNLRLRTILNSMIEAVFVTDDKGRVILTNKALDDLIAQDVRGRRAKNVIKNKELRLAIRKARKKLEATSTELETEIGDKMHIFHAQVAPLPNDEGVVTVLHDVTSLKDADRIRRNFVANASHELRTPLTALRGFIDTLVGPARDDPEARERFLETMAAEAARMSRLVDDLLSLSRIEQSEHQPPSLRVDLVDCLRGVVRSLRGYAEERNVTLDLQLVEPLPAVVADRDQLVQLLTNLIDNAIKYGGSAGEVTIRAEHVRAAPPGAGPLTGRSAVRVVVSDRGPGIAREHLPRVTERFFRVDPGRSRQLGGTGLGLAIVKHILRRHRGHLLIESELGQGTTATVYLPAPGHAAGSR
jgi:two-component system phosphate regulon sensor histidine kinase PhoR